MINIKIFFDTLLEKGINFFTGVPDSLLKDFSSYLELNTTDQNHQISSNEGSAVAMAIGHYLASKSPALVYMQNSGIGNAINPLLSLASDCVYSIPMILLIGWRAEIYESGIQLPDEPQHIHQGKITIDQLKIMDIPYVIFSQHDVENNIILIVKKLIDLSIEKKKPVAILVRKGAFEAYANKNQNIPNELHKLTREESIKNVVKNIPKKSIVVSTTGMISRELYEIRNEFKMNNNSDFMVVGGMGHAIQIAAGIANYKKNQLIVCIDGDGSFLMHSGSHVISAKFNNLLHVLLNNEAHDSVGGQPTPLNNVNLCEIAKSFGYKNVNKVYNSIEIKNSIDSMLPKEGSSFIEISCKKGHRSNLGRPKSSPKENKEKFMRYLDEQ
jgi:phosphonopyruvate decarboxylase